MFVARDAKGNLVNALEKDVTKATYLSSLWGQTTITPRTEYSEHFAHESWDCIAIFENEKSRTHGQQRALYHWAKKDNQVALEYSLPEIQQVADVLVNGN